MKASLGVLCGVVVISCFLLVSCTKGTKNVIQDGKKVSFHYTLTVDEKVVDSSEGREPLQFECGKSMIIKGLERQMYGLGVGDQRTITVSAEEGYGEVNTQLMRELPKTQLPQGITPVVGQALTVQTQAGKAIPCIISEIKEDTVMLNFNHPLAGKELSFDITIVSVE